MTNSNTSNTIEKVTAQYAHPVYKLARIHRMATETLEDAGQAKQLLMRIESFGIAAQQTDATIRFGESKHEFRFKNAESAARIVDLISILLEREDDRQPHERG